jgi:malate dehydrogenase
MASCPTAPTACPEGLISSFPVTTKDGDWEIVQGLEIDDFSRAASTPRPPSWPRSATPSRALGLIK